MYPQKFIKGSNFFTDLFRQVSSVTFFSTGSPQADMRAQQAPKDTVWNSDGASELPCEIKISNRPTLKRRQDVDEQEEHGVQDADIQLEPVRIKRQKILRSCRECSVCCETRQTRDTTKLDCCQAVYCRPCFEKWFNVWLTDKVLPICCGNNIEIENYPAFLNALLKKKYLDVKEELEADRKMACGYEGCESFIMVSQYIVPLRLFFPTLLRSTYDLQHSFPISPH